MESRKRSKWDRAEEKVFLALLKEENKLRVTEGKKPNKIFKSLEGLMLERGYPRSAKVLQRKFYYMKEAFLKAKTETKLKYFKEFSEIFGEHCIVESVAREFDEVNLQEINQFTRSPPILPKHPNITQANEKLVPPIESWRQANIPIFVSNFAPIGMNQFPPTFSNVQQATTKNLLTNQDYYRYNQSFLQTRENVQFRRQIHNPQPTNYYC